jgi:uncharacterized UPF0160 family protein
MKEFLNSTEGYSLGKLPLPCAFTHNGEIHCDDVFAAVILDMAFRGELTLFRLPEIPESFNSPTLIFFGIGGGPFDPASPDAPVRGGGKKYSTAGLVWNRFGKSVLRKLGAPGKYTDLIADKVYKDFIRYIDNAVNGDFKAEHEQIFFIKQFNDLNNGWGDTDEDSNKAFNEMFHYAHNIFDRYLKREIAIWKSKRPYKGANDGAH